MIHNHPGKSSYFNNNFADYAINQWNVKMPSLTYEEHEALSSYFLEDADFITSELGKDQDGKPIVFFLAGRSAGWLCTNNSLSVAQLEYINAQVKRLKAGKFKHIAKGMK